MLAYTDNPESIGLNIEKLEEAYKILTRAVQNKELMGAILQVSRHDRALQPKCFGRRELTPNGKHVEPDTLFQIASITKPIVSLAIMTLVDRKKLKLEDKVSNWMPAFQADQKDTITIHQLLTHTSGLQNLPSNHIELRKQNAPLKKFVEQICKDPLKFKPGTQVGYSSGAFAILGNILERIENVPLRDFMHREIFQPLGLKATSLGINESFKNNISEVAIAGNRFSNLLVNANWNLNSQYWKLLGAPWGGMFTTAEDMTKLLHLFLNEGTINGTRILSQDLTKEMITNQLLKMSNMPEDKRIKSGRGIGWNLKTGPGFGKASYSTFAHSGAIGTLAWADPKTQLTCVFLTNDAEAFNKLNQPVSEQIANAVL